jgi:hypothetical protein
VGPAAQVMRLQFYKLSDTVRMYCAVNVLKNLGTPGEDSILAHFVFRTDAKGTGAAKGRVLQGCVPGGRPRRSGHTLGLRCRLSGQ